MSKRIAICYSGQPRDAEKTFENQFEVLFKPNLGEYIIDVFAHIWYNPEIIGTLYWEEYPERGKWNSEVLDFIAQNWKPKAIKYEPPRSFHREGIVPDPRFPHPLNNTLSMFYSMWQSHQLLLDYVQDQDVTYDYVVRIRPDLVFFEPIGPISNYDPNIVNATYEPYAAHTEYAVADHIAIGGSKVMETYHNVYPHFMDLCNAGAAINPECILGFNLKVNNIPVKTQLWKHTLARDYNWPNENSSVVAIEKPIESLNQSWTRILRKVLK